METGTDRHGRIALVAVLAVVALGGIAALMSMPGGGPGEEEQVGPTSTLPDVDDEPPAPVEDEPPAPVDDEPPAPVDDEPPAISDLAAPVAATLALTSWEVTLVQEMETFDAELVSIVVGDTSFTRQRLGSVESEVITADGLTYAFEDETWFLRPDPASDEPTLSELAAMIGGLALLPAEEISRSGGVATVEVLCDELETDEQRAAAETFCLERTTLTATIDLESGRLLSFRIDGQIESFPGEYQEGFMLVRVTPMEGGQPIAAPDEVDVGRAECIAEHFGMDLSDPVALSAALGELTTAENGVLYGGCGFELFPRGNDFET